jgi:hypothetical protein
MLLLLTDAVARLLDASPSSKDMENTPAQSSSLRRVTWP